MQGFARRPSPTRHALSLDCLMNDAREQQRAATSSHYAPIKMACWHQAVPLPLCPLLQVSIASVPAYPVGQTHHM